MTSSGFKFSFEYLVNCFDELPEMEEGTGPAAFLKRGALRGAAEDLRDAQVKSEEGRMEDAWGHLVKAAETIGYLRGTDTAKWMNGPERGVVELLRKNGGLGGSTKGRNAEQKRDEAAKALIAAAPNGKWPSKAAFDLQYHNILKKVPGFSDTDHQRRKIMSRPDIKATLPADTRRKRR